MASVILRQVAVSLLLILGLVGAVPAAPSVDRAALSCVGPRALEFDPPLGLIHSGGTVAVTPGEQTCAGTFMGDCLDEDAPCVCLEGAGQCVEMGRVRPEMHSARYSGTCARAVIIGDEYSSWMEIIGGTLLTGVYLNGDPEAPGIGMIHGALTPTACGASETTCLCSLSGAGRVFG